MFKEGVYQFSPEPPGIDEDVDALIQERDRLKKQLNYANEVKDTMNQIENYLIHTADFQNKHFREAEKQIFQKHLQNAIRRIVLSTEINQELGELMNFQLLMDWSGHKKQVGDIQDDLVFQSDDFGVQGVYSKETKKILLLEDTYLNDPRSLLFVLALQGIPEKFSTYWHERIHSHQFPGKVETEVLKYAEYLAVSLSVLLGSYGAGLVGNSPENLFAGGMFGGAIFRALSRITKKNKEKRYKENRPLIETQAYTATAMADNSEIVSGMVEMPERHSPDLISLIKHLQTVSYLMIFPTDRDRIIMAYEQLGRLRALGVPELEIAKLVKRAKWNREKLQFDTLQKRIDQECKKRNIDPLDLDTIRDISHIKRTIMVYKIKLIAQEEIQSALLSLQREYERLLAEKNDKK